MKQLLKKIKLRLIDFGGYLILFLQHIPSFGLPGGMTIPIIMFFIALVLSSPLVVLNILGTALLGSYFLIEKIIVLFGIILFSYSYIYFRRMKKSVGLITTGPYKYIRHPQYLGFLLITLGFTSWSYKIFRGSFGMPFCIFLCFLREYVPVVIWFIELFLYILLASFEEWKLSKIFGTQFEDYRKNTSFLIPFIKTNQYIQIFLSILFLVMLLFYCMQL